MAQVLGDVQRGAFIALIGNPSHGALLPLCPGIGGGRRIEHVQLNAAVHGPGHDAPVPRAGQEAHTKDIGQVGRPEHHWSQIAVWVMPQEHLHASGGYELCKGGPQAYDWTTLGSQVSGSWHLGREAEAGHEKTDYPSVI